MEQSAAYYGLKIGEIYNYTPREWANYIKGKDSAKHEQLEYSRLFFTTLVNAQISKPIQPIALFPFHWDKETQKEYKLAEYDRIKKELQDKKLL